METNEEQLPQQKREGLYHVRVRKDNWEVEISAPDGQFVIDQCDLWINAFNNSEAIDSTPLTSTEPVEVPTAKEVREAHNQVAKPDTLNEFIEGIKFNSNLEKTLTFAYWREIKQDQKFFTMEDITASFREIVEKPPANLKRDLASLRAKGFLMPPEKNQDGTFKFQLSNKGMKQVKTYLGIA